MLGKAIGIDFGTSSIKFIKMERELFFMKKVLLRFTINLILLR